MVSGERVRTTNSKEKRVNVSIPNELKSLKRWVCAKNDSKVPLRAFENKAASSTDSESWSDYETALAAVQSGRYDWLGFVFADDGFVGIDIDTCYDEYGLLNELASDIIGRCQSYTEKSKSGRGYHIILRGVLPFKGKNNLAGVEIYQSSRYFIMTGKTMLYRNIVENQEAIDYVISKYFPDTVRENNSTVPADRLYTPVWENPVRCGKICLRPSYPKIQQGSRNLSLTSLAGQLYVAGYEREQILEELKVANKCACVPPLPESELKTICNSVTKYNRR